MVILILVVVKVLPGKIQKPQTGSAPTIMQDLVKTDLSKYEKDTDADGFPDFLEEQFSYDPNVSEFERCFKDSCGNADLSSSDYQKNVMVVLDSSGSMNLQIGGDSKMDLAKRALKNYVAQSGSKVKIGLFVYGHWGSNAVKDKPASCSGAEMVARIGELTPTTVDGVLAKFKPTGWTPIGLAIRNAAYELSLLPTSKKEIIVISDGEETCDTDPIGAATTAKAQGVIVSVIGFAVDANAASQLSSIATAGGGGYATANSYEELDAKFRELSENTAKLYEETKCRGNALDQGIACYKPAFQSMSQWVSDEKLKLYDKKITKDEYDRLQELNDAIYKNYTDILAGKVNELLKKAQEGKAKLGR